MICGPRVLEGRLCAEPTTSHARIPRVAAGRPGRRGGGGRGAVVLLDPPPRLHPAAAGGRSDCAATAAAASSGSPPTRRPLRALGGNKVHLCQPPSACACAPAHSGRPPRAGPAGAPRLLWAAAPAWARRAPEEVGCGVRSGRPDLPPTPSRPRGEARTRTDSCPAAALRPPPPWPVHFAFWVFGRAGSGRAGAPGVDVRVRAPGLGASAQPGRL